MSLDLRLNWRDDEGEEGPRGDRFQGERAEGEGQWSEAASRELVEGESRPVAFVEEERFQLSEDRIRDLERALGRLQGVTRPPIIGYLRDLVRERDHLTREQLEERLNGAEVWLSEQLTSWNENSRLRPGEESERERERVELFRQGMETGADALSLCGEIVAMIRGGELAVVEPLLAQVENHLNLAREALFQAGDFGPE